MSASEEIAQQYANAIAGNSQEMKIESFGYFLDNYVIQGAAVTLDTNNPRRFVISEGIISFGDGLYRVYSDTVTLSSSGTYFVDFTVANGYVVNTVHPSVDYLTLWQINTDGTGNITGTVDLRGTMGFVRFRSEIQGIITDDLIVDEEHITPGAVGTTRIANLAVTEPKLSDDSVSARTIQDNAVRNFHIIDDAVSSRNVQDRAITADHLADSSVLNRTLAPEVASRIDTAEDRLDEQQTLINALQTGDSGEAANAARYNSITGITHDTLKIRLDTEYNGFSTQFADMAQEVNTKAPQTALDTTNTVVATKAPQTALDAANAQISLRATVGYVDAQIAAVASGSPKGTYANLAALQAAIPAGNNNVYLTADNGHWNYWNGSVWTSGGVYQGTSPADGSVKLGSLDQSVRSNAYPFAPSATFGGNNFSILRAIKNIELYGANPQKHYYLSTIMRAYDNGVNPLIWNITINEQESGAVACTVNTNTNLDSTSLVEMNIGGAGISARVWIDWSELPYGINLTGMPYADAAIDYKTYVNPIYKERLTGSFIDYADLSTIPLNRYPFQPYATLNENIIKAFKSIILYGADSGDKYYISDVMRAYDNGVNPLIWNITVRDDATDEIVFQLNTNTNYDSISEVTLTNENKNMTIRFLMDWSQITNGTHTTGAGYEQSGLHISTYADRSPADQLEIVLPYTIYGVTGHELNIYFDNVINCENLIDYYIDVSGDLGQQFDNRWTVANPTAGTYPLQFRVYKNGYLVGYAQTTVIVKAASVGSGVTKSLIYIGDSTAQGMVQTGELISLFGSDVMDITLLGTRGTAPNQHEGRPGWNTEQYFTTLDFNGSHNAFLNGGSFDFPYYMAQQGYAVPNYVVINLGINDAAQSKDLDAVVTYFEQMIDSIHAYNAAIKVGINLVIPPAYMQEAFGRGNLNGLTRHDQKFRCFDLAKKCIEAFSGREGENVYVVPVNCNLDTVNNFPTQQVPTNSRNSTLVTVQNDAVHPAVSGYGQIADSIYYWIKSFES